MFILKAYRDAATFEQRFEFEGAFQDKLKWLQNNGWVIGVPYAGTRFLTEVH